MTFSIGDVLEQLSTEFPDITVSKIRFLESQGLIAPMRTASGFRMFSDTDITKLHWILLHQRDRFLPLKVIKEYLSTLSDDAFANGNLPSFDFETTGTLPLDGNDAIDLTAAEPMPTTMRDRSHLAAVPPREDTAEHQGMVTSIATKMEAPTQQSDVAESRSTSTLVQEAPPSMRMRL